MAAAITGSKSFTGTAVNDAPTATNLSAAEAYTEDTSKNLTDIVVSDVDSATVTATLTLSNTAAGSLSTATSGAVTSTYVVGTGVWSASGAIADVNALLAGVTFNPTLNFNSNFTLATSVSDGVAAAITGSKSFTGTAVNDAPVLDASKTPVLSGVNTSVVTPTGAVGTLVSALVDLNPPVGGNDNVTDPDTAPLTGIALTATSGTGTWFYSINGGGTWVAVGAVASNSALLLSADANTRLYYESGTAGTVTNAITFRAWDQTSGSAGSKVDTSTNGTATAFSTATDTANITVTAADVTPPTLNSITSTGLSNGAGSTATLTFTFSEAVTGFTLSDIVSSNLTRATISNLTTTDSIVWQATATRGASSGSVQVSVANGSFTDNAGNSGTGLTSANLPAGIAGEPINFGLTDPSVDPSQSITVTVSGLPSGWTVNGGTNNGDGSWTTVTNHPSALTVTSPAIFSGALMLDINMSWVNADGSTTSSYVASNIEAYAPGSPIFAVSADDHLTGSSGNDTFVFAQPIARDVIHSFDAAHDKIDLIGFTGVSDFASLVMADDANGNAVVTMANGSTITVMGVHAADLGAGNFEFNVEPMVVNTGLMTIADGAILPLGGLIANSGTIALGSTGSGTSLQILVESVRLQGGGQVVLSDDAHNVIYGGAANATLINHDNTISGAGQLGGGQMTLVNEGTIVANGSNALVIDTGSNTVLNSGTMEATGSGGLAVHSDLANTTGLLWANDGGLLLSGNVDGTGSGYALISGHGLVEFGAASSEDVSFAVGLGDGNGTLKLGASASFSGTVSGFNAGDALDFADVLSGADTTLVFAANADNTGGLLTLSDGTHTASVNLAGQYTAAEFQMSADLLGGTMLTLLKPLEPVV